MRILDEGFASIVCVVGAGALTVRRAAVRSNGEAGEQLMPSHMCTVATRGSREVCTRKL